MRVARVAQVGVSCTACVFLAALLSFQQAIGSILMADGAAEATAVADARCECAGCSHDAWEVSNSSWSRTALFARGTSEECSSGSQESAAAGAAVVATAAGMAMIDVAEPKPPPEVNS